jgi:hypothetical protein
MKRGDLLRHLRTHGCYLKRKAAHIRFGQTQKQGIRKPCRGITKFLTCPKNLQDAFAVRSEALMLEMVREAFLAFGPWRL